MKSDCEFSVSNARSACAAHASSAQLIKLAVFGSPGKGNRLGTECLWDIARKCNPRVTDAVKACREERVDTVNFIQVWTRTLYTLVHFLDEKNCQF